jgi:hypothetical protein
VPVLIDPAPEVDGLKSWHNDVARNRRFAL